jgi:hypothetical protein
MDNLAARQNDLPTTHSLLFVFSPTPQDRTFQIQMEQIEGRRTALLGHDVVIAEVFEDRQGQIGSDSLPAEGCDGLRRQYHVPSGRFRVLLIGKDSHIKMVADSCVSFEEVIMRVENEPELSDMSFA